MNHKILALKVKIKSLVAEVKIIRQEERKLERGPKEHHIHILYLESHRKGVVRRASRETHIAYGYLRGLTYRRIESYARTKPNWEAIVKMVRRYGPGVKLEDFEAWYKAPLKKAA